MNAAPPPRSPARARTFSVLLTWALALALGGVLILRTTFQADLSAFLPASPNATQQVLVEQVRHGAAARVLLIGIEGGDADQRAAASRALAQALRGSGRFSTVNNGARGNWARAGEVLLAHRYVLSDAVTPERFTVAGLRDGLQGTLAQLGTPAGEALRTLWQRDPTGELQRVIENLLPAQAPRMEGGVWVSRQAPRAVLLATMQAGAADMDAQAAAIGQVTQSFESLTTLPAYQGLRLQLSGPGVFAVQSRDRIRTEASWLGAVGALAMAALLALAFGRLKAVALAALPVVTGLVAGVAAVALTFGHVHGLTLGFGATLIGEAVDYAIYYLIQARPRAGAGSETGARSGDDSGAARWLHASWPTVRLGLLTSVCGFAALAVSGFPGLAQLGVFSLAGLVAAALFTRYVLPVLAPQGAAGLGQRPALGRFMQGAVRALPRWRGPLLGASAVALGYLLLAPGPVWRGDLLALSPVPREAQALDATLRADLGAADARTLVVATGPTLDQALEAAEAAATRLDRLVEDGVLAGYDTPTRVLPSARVQAARRAALPTADDLAPRVQQAVQGLPVQATALQPFLADVAAASGAPVLTQAALAGTPLAPVVDALVLAREGGGWSALLPLQPAPATGQGANAESAVDAHAPHPPHDERLDAALQGLPGVAVLDFKASLDDLYHHYLREALWQSALGALAVLGVLALSLRSARRLWAVVLPLALATVLTLAALAALGRPLGILHLVGLLLVVAVGSNYALFFDQIHHAASPAGASDPPPDDADTLASLLLANLTTVVSFALIAASRIPALSAIGEVVAPGALLALVLSAALARPLPTAPRPHP